MKISTLSFGLLSGVALAASRPADTPICDYYTTALLKDNTAKNQATVLTLLVNTAVLGSTVPKPKIDGVNFPTVTGLDGILSPNATYMGKPASIVHYFDGTLASSNRGGKSGVSVNFLDGGGAEPLMNGKPANDTSSNQYKLLTHLYEYFGALLKCSKQGSSMDFSKYEGDTGMYDVHKFMALNSSQVGYFISQVGLAAKSFGVSDDDVTAVGQSLTKLFDVRCGAATAVIPDAPMELQSICITDDCTKADNATCDKYESVMMPMMANATSPASASGSGSGSASMTGSGGSMSTGSPSGSSSGSSPTPSTGAGATNYAGAVAAAGLGALAFFL